MNKESKLNLNAGDYAISHCDSDKTYNGLEVHKMLCDAYIAGSNETFDDEAYRKAYYDGYNKCNRDWIHSQEDEKIRKALIDFFGKGAKCGEHTNGVYDKDILAWLEKQGSKDKFIEKELGCIKGYREKAIKRLEELEKQDEQKASYTTIVETGDGGINALVTRELPTDGCDDEQKPTDKVEPKFKVGDFIVNDYCMGRVVEITNDAYLLDTEQGIPFSCHSTRLWDVTKDAKDGDVLSYVTDEEDLWIMIYWSLYEPYEGHVHYHALLVNDNFSDKGTCCICIDNLKPATKEQRDLLFSKMNEAGYEWDAEKKELKKIAEKPQLKEGNFYKCIKSYYYLGGGQYWFDKGKVYFCEKDGYLRSDPNNNIYVYDCKNWQSYFRPYTKKTAEWSEEDEKMMAAIEHHLNNCGASITAILWLKSLKDKVQPQNHWKPSEEQLNNILDVLSFDNCTPKRRELLESLYEQLKKLKEE